MTDRRKSEVTLRPMWSTHIKPALRGSRTLLRLRELYWKGRFRLWRALHRGRVAADGLPIPPEQLRFLVSGDPSHTMADFLDVGRLCAGRIEETLARNGVEMRTLEAILDFGCGCGRTLRNFFPLARRTRLHGTDYNPVLVAWCRPNLPFARFQLNGLEPPLSYSDRSFDLVYALSVFTHLPEGLQHSWMTELARILKPGGHLALSTMPERMLPDDDARHLFAAGELVVLHSAEAGTNLCTAFHPYGYMKDRLTVAFDILEYVPEGIGQDFWLLRRKPA